MPGAGDVSEDEDRGMGSGDCGITGSGAVVPGSSSMSDSIDRDRVRGAALRRSRIAP